MRIVDADYEVIRGPMRQGDHHPDRPAWRFTGEYDFHGNALFRNRFRDVTWYLGIAYRGMMIAFGIAFVFCSISTLIG